MGLSEAEELEMLELENENAKAQGLSQGGNAPANASLYNLGESVTKALQPVAAAQSKIQSTIPLVAGLMNPAYGAAMDAGQRIMGGVDQISQKLGGIAAENLPKTVLPPMASAAIGTGISMAPQIAGAFLPGPEFPEMQMLKPIAGPGRLEGVEAAAEAGVPLTRAEITGSKPTSLIESALEKSLTGSGQIQRFRRAQSAAIENTLQAVKRRFGSQEPLSSSGSDAHIGMQSELGQARETGRQLYRDVPDVPIPPTTLMKALDDIAFNNPDNRVQAIVNEVKGRLGSQPPITEATTPQSFGSTTRTIQEKTPGGIQSVPGEGNILQPPSAKDVTTDLQSQYRVGPKTPDQPSVPTFQKLNEVRNLLSKEIQAQTTFNPITGNQISETGRSLVPLKKALDADIQQYVKGQTTPYGKMEAKEFDTAFTKANSFHGTVKDLINNKLVRKLSKAPESDVSKIVFGPGRKEDVLLAKATMGQEGYSAIKRQYFNDLLESKNIGGALDKLEPEFLQTAFRPQELEALRKIDAIKKVSLGAEKLAGNASGTGQTVATGATFAGLGHAALKAVSHPLLALTEAASILGIPYATAKAYLGTTAGIPLPVNAASHLLTKGGAAGLNVIGQNPGAQQTLMKILQRIRQNADKAKQPPVAGIRG